MNQNDMEKKLDQLLADLPKPQYDTDKWLIEDHTAEFDRIVGQRRRKVWMQRWAAAAVVAGFLCLIGITLEQQTKEPLPPVAETTVKQKSVEPQPLDQVEETKLADARPVQTAPVKAKRMEKPATAQPSVRQMTPIDSLADIVAHIEESMQGIRDSCYMANVEKLIRTDDRLQRLVNNLIIEGIITEKAVQTALVNPQNNN